jgi:hypothetical protein
VTGFLCLNEDLVCPALTFFSTLSLIRGKLIFLHNSDVLEEKNQSWNEMLEEMESRCLNAFNVDLLKFG